MASSCHHGEGLLPGLHPDYAHVLLQPTILSTVFISRCSSRLWLFFNLKASTKASQALRIKSRLPGMVYRPLWSGTTYMGSHIAHYLITHSHWTTFCSAKAALLPFPLAPYARCSLCLNVLLWALTWLTSPSGLHLSYHFFRTLPGPSYLHYRMDFHQVSPGGLHWHLSDHLYTLLELLACLSPRFKF